ncbi:conserved protein, unknown function [Hepatocystis sp. ex Piliocolobus tephrosceles]|nr:conserved protein, unknown function [Hepatocystis sp. ex Piliocolobus tephrosceles]
MESIKLKSRYEYPGDMNELIKLFTNVMDRRSITDIDKKKLWNIANNMYEQWCKLAQFENENDKTDYYKLVAFLNLLLSTSWFSEKEKELNDIITDIYCNYVNLATKFTEDEVIRAIENSLNAKCIISKNKLVVEFVDGNYGEGPFDGKLILDMYEGLILDTGIKVLQYVDRLPEDSHELEEAILSFDWEIYDGKQN